MDIPQPFIFDASWFFFAGWSILLAAVSVITFRRDLLRFKARNHSNKKLG